MDCSSVSAAERVCDCDEGVQCPKERNPIFFMRAIYRCPPRFAIRDLQAGLATRVRGVRVAARSKTACPRLGRSDTLTQDRTGTARIFRHQAWRSVRRLADMSRVRGMNRLDIHSFGSVILRMAGAAAATCASE